jgi:RNA binding exosome subunit
VRIEVLRMKLEECHKEDISKEALRLIQKESGKKIFAYLKKKLDKECEYEIRVSESQECRRCWGVSSLVLSRILRAVDQLNHFPPSRRAIQ